MFTGGVPSLEEYAKTMYADAASKRQKNPESRAAVIMENLADLATVVGQEIDRRFGGSDEWRE